MNSSARTSSTALPTANGTIIAALIVAALHFGSTIFIPLALAVLLSFALNPVVAALRSLRIPRGIAISLVVGCFVVLVGLAGMVMARQVRELANDLPRYQTVLQEKLKTVRAGFAQSGIADRASETLKQLGKELEQSPSENASKSSAGVARDASTSVLKPIPVEVHPLPERPLELFQRVAKVLLAPLTTTGVVLLLLIFILFQREDVRDRIIRLAGPRDIDATTTAINDAAYRLSKLFLSQLALNASYGIVIALGLWAIGVPSPGLWGIIAGMMRFIPYIGAVFAIIFPLLLAAAVDPGWSMLIWTAALYAICEPAVGHFLEPLIQGKTTGLSPLAIVFSAIIWTALWGPIGLLLATPLTMCLVVLGRHVEGLGFLDVVLGDEPPLSAPEMFYQRLLAGSLAEAADQAEQHLKKNSLLQYYENVAMPGLAIASDDARRGSLDDLRMSELRDGLVNLLEDLADEPVETEKKQPVDQLPEQDHSASLRLRVLTATDLSPEWRAETPSILCLGAQTPVDTAAAEVLAQVLRQYGLPARVASSTRLSDIGRLDLSGTRVVWVSSFDASFSLSHIRYITRRLRRSVPGIVICGGFWNRRAQHDRDEAGLDRQVASLTDAVLATTQLATGGTSRVTAQAIPSATPDRATAPADA